MPFKLLRSVFTFLQIVSQKTVKENEFIELKLVMICDVSKQTKKWYPAFKRRVE